MSLFNRLTTWAAGQSLKSADLNGEFNNLVNGLNNLDGATTAWTNVKTGGLTVTGTITAPSFVGWTSFSPSLSAGFGTVSNSSGFYRRMGDTMIVRCTFKTGTISGSAATIAIPTGAIDYTKISTNGDAVGQWWNSHTETIMANNDSGPVFVDGSDTATFFFGQSGTTGGLFAKGNVNTVVHSTNDYFYFRAEIPISTWTF